MIKTTKFLFIFVFAFLSTTSSSWAGVAFTPIAVSIVPPIQFPPDDFAITGARASILWGKHRDVYGLDLGIVGNITEQDFVGLGVSGIFNVTHGSTTILGLQLAGAANINTQKTNIFGIQAAVGENQNTAASTLVGLQIAAVNQSGFTDIYGIQAGIYNKAHEVYGFQIGIVNVTDALHGIQIGLVNFNSKGPFGVSPILNVGF